MCCRICFWADRLLAKMKCPKYFFQNPQQANGLVHKTSQQRCVSVKFLCFSLHISITLTFQDQSIPLLWWTVGTHPDTFFQAAYMCVWVCDSGWMTMLKCACLAVGRCRDQWRQSADRLTHTKTLCHYRDQTVQGHDFHFHSSHWKNAVPALLTCTSSATWSGSIGVIYTSNRDCRWSLS